MNTALAKKYGQPVPASPQETAQALFDLKLSGHVLPHQAMVFRYSSHEAAEAFAAANLEHNGFPSLGILDEPGGTAIGVIDTRLASEKGQA